MNKRIALSILSITAAMAMVTGSAFAAFSSSASSVGNTFATGNMTLVVTPDGGVASGPTFTVSGIAPGDTKYQLVTLSNTGSIGSATTKLTDITQTFSDTPNLADVLNLEIYDDVSGDDFILAGVVSDPSTDDVLRGSAPVSSAAWSNINLGFGLLPLIGTHKIVAKVTFDLTAGDAYQSKSSAFNLNFQTNQ